MKSNNPPKRQKLQNSSLADTTLLHKRQEERVAESSDCRLQEQVNDHETRDDDVYENEEEGYKSKIKDLEKLIAKENKVTIIEKQNLEIINIVLKTSCDAYKCATILKTMKSNYDSVRVQKKGLEVLSDLLNFHTRVFEKRNIDLDDIYVIIEAMEKHSGKAYIQELGCTVLRMLTEFSHHLSIENDTNLKNGETMLKGPKKIGDIGGIEVILKGMQKYESDANIQEQGCAVLCNIARDDNIVKIGNLGGIEVMLNGMKKHKSNANVQEKGFAALSNLAIDDNLDMKIISLGGIEVILNGMKTHENADNVFRSGCMALRNLTCNIATAEGVGHLGGIQVILNGMKKFENIADIQEQGCGVLRNLVAENNCINRVIVINLGGIEVIFNALEKHESDAEVQEEGYFVLCSLFQNSTEM
jgi:hypothetical protein